MSLLKNKTTKLCEGHGSSFNIKPAMLYIKCQYELKVFFFQLNFIIKARKNDNLKQEFFLYVGITNQYKKKIVKYKPISLSSVQVHFTAISGV